MPKLTAVRVASRPERGFNHAGRFWPAKATDAEVDEKTLAKIESCSDLVVVRFPPGVSLEKPSEASSEAKGGEASSSSENAPQGEPTAATNPAASSAPKATKAKAAAAGAQG
jgi:hypothetical protein